MAPEKNRVEKHRGARFGKEARPRFKDYQKARDGSKEQLGKS